MAEPRALFAALVLALAVACVITPPPPPPAPPPPPPDPWAAVDAYALAAPESATASAGALAAYLRGAGPGEEAVARALFRWITANVGYDLEGMRSGHYGDLSPDAVLARRTAVCEGYGSLFERLATLAGLEAVTVHGYAKGVGYRVGSPVPGPPNHAWNAVRIGGVWRLLDCTWGAGILDEGGVYLRAFEPFYFLTPPEQFLFTHWPLEERWQLVERPISRQAFEALPWLKPAFFHAGLSAPPDACAAEGREVVLRLSAPPEAELRAYLLSGGEKVGEAPMAQVVTGESVEFRAPRAGTGPFAVRLFAHHPGAPDLLEWAADFPLEPRAAPEAPTADGGP